MEPLANRYRLVIPDLRGCGRSRDLPPPYSVKQQAADLSKLLDHLSIASTDALGYSQDGSVVQQLALDYPKKVNRLILANTYAYNMASFREKLEGNLVPILFRLLGTPLFAKLIISPGVTRPEGTSREGHETLRRASPQDNGGLMERGHGFR